MVVRGRQCKFSANELHPHSRLGLDTFGDVTVDADGRLLSQALRFRAICMWVRRSAHASRRSQPNVALKLTYDRRIALACSEGSH